MNNKTSVLLSCVSAAGVVATSVFAVKATPKAMQLIDEARKEKGEELTAPETIKAAWKPYIPAAAIGLSTIVCIAGTSVLNAKSQATMAAAYALAENGFRAYKNKAKEIVGDKRDHEIKEAIAHDEYEEREVTEGKKLFFDFQTLTYFEANMEDVVQKTTMNDGLECYIISTPAFA